MPGRYPPTRALVIRRPRLLEKVQRPAKRVLDGANVRIAEGSGESHDEGESCFRRNGQPSALDAFFKV